MSPEPRKRPVEECCGKCKYFDFGCNRSIMTIESNTRANDIHRFSYRLKDPKIEMDWCYFWEKKHKECSKTATMPLKRSTIAQDRR